MIDFREIMVFAGEPENGCVAMACGRRFARAGDCGSGFQRRIERTAEQTHLLAGEDGACTLFQRGKRVFRGRRSVLLGEQVDKLGPVRGAWRLGSTNLIQRQKGAERPGTKIEKESALARHYGHWITIGFQGFVHWRLVWLG